MEFYVKVEGISVPVHPIGRYNNTIYLKIEGLDTKDIHDISVHLYDLWTSQGKATKEIIDQYFKTENEYKN